MRIEFDSITKKYGSVVAVSDLSLSIQPGDFLVLLGPSGCGKTTLLRCLAGLESIDGGEIHIGEERVDSLPPYKRDLAMVFQNYALYPHLTVLENIAFPLEAKKVPKDERSQRALEVAERLGIGVHADKMPKQLSGGEAQRVALGRAIIRNPKVFLMDEPFSNLDAKLRLQMRVELQRLHRELGITTVFVTHDQEEAMTLGKTIAIIKKGVLQQVGTPWEVYNRPANLFVAGFIGNPEMNMFDAEMGCDGELPWLGINGARIRLPIEWKSSLDSNLSSRSVTVGIRPEDISLVVGYEMVDTEEDALWGEVDVVELVGRELRAYVRFADRNIVVICDPDTQLKEGIVVAMRPNPNKLHLFNPKTETRIDM